MIAAPNAILSSKIDHFGQCWAGCEKSISGNIRPQGKSLHADKLFVNLQKSGTGKQQKQLTAQGKKWPPPAFERLTRLPIVFWPRQPMWWCGALSVCTMQIPDHVRSSE